MKKKNFSVLLLLRKNDPYCKKFLKFIVSQCKKTKVFWSVNNKKNSSRKQIKKRYDFIISYRSSVILSNKEISMANNAAINLHPGPPKYRGIGCLNYALYNNEKKYGFTIHLINKKIDYGKILFVKYFTINKKITVTNLLDKTHDQCVKYSKPFFRNILKNPTKINLYKDKFKKEKWSKIIKNKIELNKFYRIENFDLKEVEKKIRATNYLNFKPYIQIGINKFILE